MSRYYSYSSSYYGYAPYISVGAKKHRNRKAMDKLKKKGVELNPIVIEGRTIAKSWWGKSWNENLERYADYSNRIQRGRSYVRHGAVIDLKLQEGKIEALVQGSGAEPYKVAITIQKLADNIWDKLKKESLSKLQSLNELLSGKFPKELRDLFFLKGEGIFPTPDEISFSCSCPDWASMCKHITAVLYGIGNRLDSDPELIFKLRHVSVDELVSHTLKAATDGLISKAHLVTEDEILKEDDLQDVFGIKFDDNPVELNVKLPSVETQQDKQPISKNKKKTTNNYKKKKQKRNKSVRVSKKQVDIKPVSGKMSEQLCDVVKNSKSPFRIKDLEKQLPLWTKSQIANTIQRLIQARKIQRVKHGVYKVVPYRG